MSKMARITFWLIGLGILISISLVVGIYLLSQNESADFSGSPKILHLDIESNLRDLPGSGSLLDDPESLPPLTTELSRLLLDASTDDSIRGLHIHLKPINLGWAQVHELRSGIAQFVDSGKPCTLHTDALSNKEYYLASACSDIHISPNGIFLVNGLSVTQSYYANLFEKLNISANFAHVGDFKSAVEPYERTGPSDAASEATNALLDSLYQQLQKSIASGRSLSETEALALLDDPPFTPKSALEQGLIDGLSYSDELFDAEEDVIYSDRYLKKRRSAWQKSPDKIAVIHAEGAIVSGDSGESMFGGQFVGDATMTKYIRKVKKDESVKAVVLRVNSPGGSGAASDIIWHELEELQAAGKSVVVSMGDYAASGGYYISMGSDYIFAQPNTITGSIGVFGGKINISGLYDYAGITQHTYQRGHFSTIFSEVHNFDDRHRAKYQDFLNGFYDVFISKAAEGRNMDKDAVHQVAQGRVWTGEQALERGLVDELGGLHKALEKAAELESLSSFGIVRYPEHKTLLEAILEDFSNPEDQKEALLQQVQQVKQLSPQLPQPLKETVDHALVLERILDGYGAAAILPGQLQID